MFRPSFRTAATATTSGLTRRHVVRLAALGSGAVAAVAATGCGAETGPLPAAKSTQPVKISYLHPHQPGTLQAQKDQAMFARFSEQYPHLTVEMEVPGNAWAQVREKLIVATAGGAPPSFVQNGWVGPWTDLARGGAVRELSSLFKADKLDPGSIFIPSAVEFHTAGSTLYGFPASLSCDSIMFNATLFDREGIPTPSTDKFDPAWTMEKFLEVAQKLTKPGEQAGMMNVHSSQRGLYGFNRGTWFGHSTWDDKKRQAAVNHPLLIRGVQFWQDLVYRYNVVPDSAALVALRGGVSNAFMNGKAAMVYGCCPLNYAEASFKWGIGTLPYSGPAGSKNIAGRVDIHSLVVPKGLSAEKSDAVWLLFRWFMAKPENGGLMPPANSHAVTPYKDARFNDVSMKDFEQASKGVTGKALLLQSQTAPASSCGMYKYEEYDTALWPAIQDAWGKTDTNQMPAREYAAIAQKAVDDARLGSRSL